MATPLRRPALAIHPFSDTWEQCPSAGPGIRRRASPASTCRVSCAWHSRRRPVCSSAGHVRDPGLGEARGLCVLAPGLDFLPGRLIAFFLESSQVPGRAGFVYLLASATSMRCPGLHSCFPSIRQTLPSIYQMPGAGLGAAGSQRTQTALRLRLRSPKLWPLATYGYEAFEIVAPLN